MDKVRVTLELPIMPSYINDEKLVKLVNDSLEYYNKPIESRGKLPKEDMFFHPKLNKIREYVTGLEIIQQGEEPENEL